VTFRFYANENLSADLVKALQHLGYDVLTSYEAGNANQRIPDDQVLQTAIAENRAVITFNRDDFLALHRSGVEHSGIVVCKDDSNVRGMGQALHDYLDTQQTLQNRLLRVLQKNQPGINYPVFAVREYSRD
jgi:predicted nuclease of predicted toxin-antitoxin system